MRRGSLSSTIFYAVVLCCISVLWLRGCGGDSGPTPSSLAITTTALPEQTVNHPYSASMSGSGGAPPYTWSVSPALPGNLSLDAATGAITGTPTTQGTTTHTFTLRDSSAPSQTVEQSLNLTIEPSLAITTTSLPDASISSSYNEPVQTVGGIGALTFSIVPGTGTLPQNLSLNPTTGMISGTPIAPGGTFPFTVQVADTSGQQDTKALSVRVTPTTPPQITTTSLPSGTAGQFYNQRVQATGGIGSLAWSISAGSLPPGLTLNPSGPAGGTISGTPTSGGSFTFTVKITDSVGQNDTQDLSISVTPLSITTTSLPSGSLGQAYGPTTVQTVGGIAPLNFSISQGSLPAGLTLGQTTGVISGTPMLPGGQSSFTVRVQDAGGQSATKALSITINVPAPPRITTTTLPGGTVGLAYNQTLQATAGTGALTWSLSGGSLPAGLTLSPAGVISGTPTTAGNKNFTVRVTDSLNLSDTQDLSIVISAALSITTNNLPDAHIGKAYNQTLQRSGGVSPFKWSVTPALPSGLSLNASTGQITGAPAGPEEDDNPTFTVQDSSTPTPQTDSKSIRLRIRK